MSGEVVFVLVVRASRINDGSEQPRVQNVCRQLAPLFRAVFAPTLDDPANLEGPRFDVWVIRGDEPAFVDERK